MPKIQIHSSKFAKIVHVEYPSLITASTFVIPTVGWNNKGHAHTLEHLVFLGSKRYPYKGILDVLANRCYANGTNAWTDVDHTAYTLDTVSWEGLQVLLPVYYDHILNPTLTKSAYTTEVHHISPEFKDAGVVYCEMEGRENSAEDILQHSILNAVYPNSPYGYECGGLTKDIQSLTLEEIQEYHQTYYDASKTLLIICGTYPREKLLELLADLDKVADRKSESKTYPSWKDIAVFPISTDEVINIEFPDELEETGIVSFSFSAEEMLNVEVLSSLNIITTYLTGSSGSFLQHLFTEENNWCSDVSSSIDYRKIPNYYIICSDVPCELLQMIPDKMKIALNRHLANGLDFDRITLCITRLKDQLQYDLENKPNDLFNDILIPSILD
eukprot:NODE_930_length_3034_cov_1.043271.p1 type:complete len:386 gc:universal NODE_930_length_3034_cov_1.043271:1368-211(-)